MTSIPSKIGLTLLAVYWSAMATLTTYALMTNGTHSNLLLISELEGSYHHCRINGFEEDQRTIRAICDKYYKLYFKLKREQA